MHAHIIHCTVVGAHEKRAQHFSWAPDSSLEMNDEANNKCCTKANCMYMYWTVIQCKVWVGSRKSSGLT